MIPKNTKSFPIGYTQAVNARYQYKGTSIHPSLVILGSGSPLILCGAETLTELNKSIKFALQEQD